MPHYDGSYRGQGRFRPDGADESFSVTYDLFQSSEVLRHLGRGEVRRKIQLTGTIAPILEGIESPRVVRICLRWKMVDGWSVFWTPRAQLVAKIYLT
jgi:hypothetical protein